MNGVANIEMAGRRLDLLGQGAVWIPQEKTLLVADTHFGKEATFRRNHIPVPIGSTDGTLTTLNDLVERNQPRRLIILGDMFHARSSLSPQVCESLASFFDAHRDVEFLLVRGNHDVHVGPLPKAWPIEVVPQHRIDNIALTHHPAEVPPSVELLICGHLHPAIRISGRVDSTGKLPCFWLSQRRLVLPAIGEFTGTHRIRPKRGDRTWIIVDGQVIEHSPLAQSLS